MNLISFTTFMLAAGINLQAAYGAEAKQHVRKLQSDETGEQVEKELEDIAAKWYNWDKWGEHGGGAPGTTPPPPGTTPPPIDCPLGGGLSLQSIETICLILPLGMSQPGTPSMGVTDGIFCSSGYDLIIDDVSQGNQKLLRANLELPTFMQDPPPGGTTGPTGGGARKLEGEGLPPIVVQALTGVPAPSGDIAMITGGTAPSDIVFQGFWDDDECSFRLVSTQGGHLIGKFDGSSDFTIEFTQTGQVTSLLSSLKGQFEGAIGTITLDFAFAFKGLFGEIP